MERMFGSDEHRVPESAGPPLRLGGRYELRRELGRGGEASVYAATDLVLAREVAVKVFHQRAIPPSEGRLEQLEARVAATLNHYALTTLLDSGVDTGPEGDPQLYMVMEYVPGENLRSRLRRGPMSAAEACWLGFDLAEGLDYMHQTGFIHRDVKPANVLISSQRSVRPVVAKLTDFGITAAVGEPDLSEFTIGTAAYLSPEQVEGNDAEPASDVYSLGLVILEAMTGRTAFPGPVTISAFARLNRDPQIPDSIPSRTADLLRQMTQRTPRSRVGLFDAAVELQQILVDDLVARRAAPTPTNAVDTLPRAAAPTSSGGAPVEAQPGLEVSARLIAQAADVPMIAIVLQAEDGARLAGASGWSEPPTALTAAAARFPVDAQGLWAVPDITASEFRAGLPSDVRSIASARITGADGRALGSLVACDQRPRPFTSAQLGALRDGAELIATDLQLRQAIRRILFPSA